MEGEDGQGMVPSCGIGRNDEFGCLYSCEVI